MDFLSPITALIAAGITVPALVALYFLKLRRRSMVVSSTLLWKKSIHDMQVNAPFQRLRKSLLLLLQLLILAGLLLAMARPTTSSIAAPGQRVVIVVDHSASMNATDVAPTRLAAAKKAALHLIDSLDTSAAGDGSHGQNNDGGAMVVDFAQQASVIQPFTTEPAKLRRAVRAIPATDQPSNLVAALRVIAPHAARAAAARSSGLVVYLISDGRVRTRGNHGPIPLKGADVRYIRIGRRSAGGRAAKDGRGSGGGGNLAIVALSARREPSNPQVVQLFARLSNDGAAPLTTNLTLRLDGQVQRVETVTVPGRDSADQRTSSAKKKSTPGSRQSGVRSQSAESGHQHAPPSHAASDNPHSKSVQFQFTLPGPAMVALSQDHVDALAADDVARIQLAPARRLRVLLVTKGNAFLKRVIRSVGVRDLVVMSPKQYANQDPDALRRAGWNAAGTTGGVARGYDVIFFDSYAPKRVPPVASVSFGATVPIKGLAERGGDGIVASARQAKAKKAASAGARDQGAQVILDWKRDNPLMRYVSLDDVVVSHAGRLVVPDDATVLAVGQSGPLMAAAPAAGHLHVVTSFTLLKSNWPLYVSFPVFIDNAVQTLGLGSLTDKAGLSYMTGQVAVIPLHGEGSGGDGEVRYTGPVDVSAPVRQGRAVLPMWRRVGVYQANGGLAQEVQPPYETLPVNLLDANESDLRPASVLDVGTTSPVKGRAQSRSVRREVWPWFVWGALGVLVVEWLVYTRRMHV